MGVNGGALQLCAVYKSRILLQVKREKSVLALQVMHAASEKCNEIKGLYGKIIITMYSTKLYRKKIITCLLLLALFTCAAHFQYRRQQTCDIYHGDAYINTCRRAASISMHVLL